jgi:hypothetical protein
MKPDHKKALDAAADKVLAFRPKPKISKRNSKLRLFQEEISKKTKPITKSFLMKTSLTRIWASTSSNATSRISKLIRKGTKSYDSRLLSILFVVSRTTSIA